ncbi:MAG: PAS domain-containing protein [Rectinemataceae bacterium]
MKLDETVRSLGLLELLDCIDDDVLILDRSLRVIKANRRAVVFFGYPELELTAMNLLALVAADQRKWMAKFVRGAKDRREGRAIFLTRSRRKIPRRFSLCPLSNNGEEFQGYLLVSRLSGREDIFRIDDASNGLADRMLRGVPDPLFIIDGSSRTVRDCNEAALSTFGFAREDVVGRRLLTCSMGGGERGWNEVLEARADNAYATAGIFRERLPFPRRDGPALLCDFTGLPIFRPDGSLAIIIAMLVDRSSEETHVAEIVGILDRGRNLVSDFAALLEGYSTKSETKSLAGLGFTPRQIEIARLVSLGASSKEIGFRLGIAESTVKSHLTVIFRKLGTNSRLGFIRALAERHIRIS